MLLPLKYNSHLKSIQDSAGDHIVVLSGGCEADMNFLVAAANKKHERYIGLMELLANIDIQQAKLAKMGVEIAAIMKTQGPA